MNVTVKYPAVLNIARIKSGGTVEIQGGTTIEDLLAEFNIKKEHRKYVRTFVNGEQKNLSHTLHDKDELQLFFPMGGG